MLLFLFLKPSSLMVEEIETVIVTYDQNYRYVIVCLSLWGSSHLSLSISFCPSLTLSATLSSFSSFSVFYISFSLCPLYVHRSSVSLSLSLSLSLQLEGKIEASAGCSVRDSNASASASFLFLSLYLEERERGRILVRVRVRLTVRVAGLPVFSS
jgi:hypothetical protein